LAQQVVLPRQGVGTVKNFRDNAKLDLKAFVIGAGSGALLYAAIGWLLDDRRHDQPHDRPDIAQEAPVAPSVPESVSDNASPALPIRTGPAGVDDASKPASPQTGVTDPEPVASSDSGNPEDRWLADAYGRLVAEPKDDSWSHYVEQGMLQYLASSPAMGKFEISYLECRTTFCQIKVTGYDESTGPTWDQIMYDMRSQPWYEFGQRGGSSALIDGRLVIIQDLQRR
jgi:hypothetical protein